MNVKPSAIEILQELHSAKKFERNASEFYPGVNDMKIKFILTECLNECIEDFMSLANDNKPERDFLVAIEQGLKRFDESGIFDTEEREQICSYFEKMMDAVGLESSNGILNTWMYGFDV